MDIHHKDYEIYTLVVVHDQWYVIGAPCMAAIMKNAHYF